MVRELLAILFVVVLCDLTIYRGQGFAGYAALVSRRRPCCWLGERFVRGLGPPRGSPVALLAVVAAKSIWCGSALSWRRRLRPARRVCHGDVGADALRRGDRGIRLANHRCGLQATEPLWPTRGRFARPTGFMAQSRHALCGADRVWLGVHSGQSRSGGVGLRNVGGDRQARSRLAAPGVGRRDRLLRRRNLDCRGPGAASLGRGRRRSTRRSGAVRRR